MVSIQETTESEDVQVCINLMCTGCSLLGCPLEIALSIESSIKAGMLLCTSLFRYRSTPC